MRRSTDRIEKRAMASAVKKDNTATKVIDSMLMDETEVKREAEEAAEEAKEEAAKEAEGLDEINEIIEETEKKGIMKKLDAEKEESKKESRKQKAASSAGEQKIYFEIQYTDHNVITDEIIEMVKKDWAAKSGTDSSKIKALAVYFKPEENHVYYVIDGEERGDFEL